MSAPQAELADLEELPLLLALLSTEDAAALDDGPPQEPATPLGTTGTGRHQDPPTVSSGSLPGPGAAEDPSQRVAVGGCGRSHRSGRGRR